MTAPEDGRIQVHFTGGALDSATAAKLRDAISRAVKKAAPPPLPPLGDLPLLAKVADTVSRTLRDNVQITSRFPDGPGTVLADLRRAMALIREHDGVPLGYRPRDVVRDPALDRGRGPATHLFGIPVFHSRALPADVHAVYSPTGIFVRDQWRDLALPLLLDHVRRQAEDDLVAIAAAAERRLGLSPAPCPCGAGEQVHGDQVEDGACEHPARLGGLCAYCRRWCSP